MSQGFNEPPLSASPVSTGLMLTLRQQDFDALVLRTAQLAVELLGERPEYMTSEEVQAYLGYSKSRINNLCSQGRIPFYKDGNRRIFVRQEIDAWVKGLDRITVQEAWALVP
jgi:excisionase family DNA binding protein